MAAPDLDGGGISNTLEAMILFLSAPLLPSPLPLLPAPVQIRHAHVVVAVVPHWAAVGTTEAAAGQGDGCAAAAVPTVGSGGGGGGGGGLRSRLVGSVVALPPAGVVAVEEAVVVFGRGVVAVVLRVVLRLPAVVGPLLPAPVVVGHGGVAVGG